MRISRFVLVSLVLFSALLPAVGVAADGAQGLDEMWRKAILAGDLDGLVACYADDAVVWAPDSPEARGHDAIRATFAGMLAGFKVTAATLSDTHYETSGKVSVGWGNVSLTMAPVAGGDPMTFEARFTSVAKKVGGKWVYVVDHASHAAETEGED